MALNTGTRLGHYEVVSLLGQGGMGEVYRARDTELKRDVAIKVLPAGVAADPERLARFKREAEILASLNHPGIAAIYGLVENALVMELAEGETLPCPVPLETAIAYAKQIADAVEYAHDRGVIHRDLKPANIKVTQEGTIKILDFGLAKALDERAAAGENPNNSPTLTMGATQAGMILGTAAYMSPEQAVGKAADRRADVFSFGAVLYEMLSGKRAFAGESVGETLAAVVKDTPDWSALPSATPKYLRNLLERALAKDRRQRLQAMGEARIILEKGEPADSGSGSPAQAPTRRPYAAVALGVVAAGLALVHFREKPPELRAVNTTLLPPENAEFDFNTPFATPALSPDGTRIVFGARVRDGKQQLWLRRLDSPTAQPLPGTEGAATPFWSPDSRWVAFGQENRLKKIDIQGGPPLAIAEVAAALRGGTWNQQGVILFGLNLIGPIWRVASAGGTPAPVTAPAIRGVGDTAPFFLPDGRHFLYTNYGTGSNPIYVSSLDEPGQPGKKAAEGAYSPAVYAQGNLLYLRENTLMAQAFDVDRLETKGEAVAVAEGLPVFTSWGVTGFAVSPDGLLLHLAGGAANQSRLWWKDRQGKVLGSLGMPTSAIGNVAISPDAKSVAVSFLARNGETDLWIYDVAQGIPTRFTFDPRSEREPVWSPDGKMLYFHTNRAGEFQLFRKPSNGTGTEEPLGGSLFGTPNSVSPDGKLLLYHDEEGKTGRDLWVLPLTPPGEGGKLEPRVFLQTPFAEQRGQFSPDGKWVAYQSNESGQFQIYVVSFPGPGGKRQISSGGGMNARWRRDGKEIFYLTPDGQLMAAEVEARNATLEVGRVQKLFDGIVTSRGILYDVSADGQKFLVDDEGGVATTRPLTLIQNWTASLRK